MIQVMTACRTKQFSDFSSSVANRFFLVSLWPKGGHDLIHNVSRSHSTTHHSRYDTSGRMISPSQRPLPTNSQQWQTSMSPAGFEPTNQASKRPQIHACGPRGAMTSSFTRFLDHTRRTTVGTTPLDKWSARRRDLHLTTHNDRHPCPRRDSNPQTKQASKQAAADPRLRPRGHWDRRFK